MLLRLQVVTADCAPIAGARVDVWHCDAAGVYSGVQGDTGTFLRGSQDTGGDGVATFRTVFPGWYPGRVVHVHYKVFLPGGREVLTSQVFFDDAFAGEVHADHPAYEARGRRIPPCGPTGSPGRRAGGRWRGWRWTRPTARRWRRWSWAWMRGALGPSGAAFRAGLREGRGKAGGPAPRTPRDIWDR